VISLKSRATTQRRAPRTPHIPACTDPSNILVPSASIAFTAATMTRRSTGATAAAAAAAAALLVLLASVATVSATPRGLSSSGPRARRLHAAVPAVAADANTAAAATPGVATDADATSAVWPEGMSGRVSYARPIFSSTQTTYAT